MTKTGAGGWPQEADDPHKSFLEGMQRRQRSTAQRQQLSQASLAGNTADTQWRARWMYGEAESIGAALNASHSTVVEQLLVQQHSQPDRFLGFSGTNRP